MCGLCGVYVRGGGEGVKRKKGAINAVSLFRLDSLDGAGVAVEMALPAMWNSSVALVWVQLVCSALQE